MSPEQYIKKGILDLAREWKDGNKNLSEEELKESGDWCDAYREFREGQVETPEIETEWSRHYESKAVAAQIDGVWVGWTYWYGGGKHGEPQEIEWMENSYFLDCVEEEKLVTVRTFKKK